MTPTTPTTIQVASRGDMVVLTVGPYPEVTITVTEALRFTELIESAIATVQALDPKTHTVH